MTRIARFPRLAAWLITLALIAALTLGSIQALNVLEPRAPAGLAHVQGIIIALRAESVFGVRVPGQGHQSLWFRPAPGAPISLAHLRRHLHEGATTDIFYLPASQTQGVWLAWEAD